MRVVIPENMGGELKVLPNGHCTAVINSFHLGKSREGNPKLTCKWTVTSEMYDDPTKESSIGETVLETFSLLPQALFNLNGLYKASFNKNLPMGDYELEEFVDMISADLVGLEYDLILEQEVSPTSGQLMTKVKERSYKS